MFKTGAVALTVLLFAGLGVVRAIEQRNKVDFLRGPYNMDFFRRHNAAFRVGAGLHFAHGKQHDVLLLTPLSERDRADREFFEEARRFVLRPSRTEPEQEYYAPYTSQTIWLPLLTIDWTHMHHEQTYDIMSDRGITWSEKRRWTDRSVRYYLGKQVRGVPRSVAPIDVTMRRTAVMMKPYFTYFRNYYPLSNNFFYGAHWWHPVIYEAMMIAGNDREQETSVRQVSDVYYGQVLKDPPLRMLLSREIMPRYSRMTPESANIFDQLHMLHGIVYDILAYEGWTIEQKEAEITRVIHAMSYQPGDENLVRKFPLPRPDIDPRVYSPWLKAVDGEMNRIMFEMLEEMMPMMMPDASQQQREAVREQLRLKLAPGMQPGEFAGAFHDAVMKVVPGMRTMPGSTEPGTVAPGMVARMLAGWSEKYGMMPDAPPIDITHDPVLPPIPAAGGGIQ